MSYPSELTMQLTAVLWMVFILYAVARYFINKQQGKDWFDLDD